MGGDLPDGGVSGGVDLCAAEGADASSPLEEEPSSSVLRGGRARCSRARRSSPSRCASITAGLTGPAGVRGDGGGDVSLSAREVVGLVGPRPRRPRTTVHPPSREPSPLGGEVWVAAVASGAAAGSATRGDAACGALCAAGGGAGCAARVGDCPEPVASLSPKDCSMAMSWLIWLCPSSGRAGVVAFVTEAYERLG